jgi:hypothetical protein
MPVERFLSLLRFENRGKLGDLVVENGIHYRGGGHQG